MKKKPMEEGNERSIELVLKCDSRGSLEAANSAIEAIRIPGIKWNLIHYGVGDVAKSDLLLAVTGSRLVVGFNVGTGQKIEQMCKEQGIEVRLYNVIYRLVDDLREIGESLKESEVPEEKITGKARVIALFKGGRKGIILGCEVMEGVLVKGGQFRIISAMGVIYTGRIESLQIEKNAVREARPRQQVGIKISNFKKSLKIGDLIECFESAMPQQVQDWRPRGGVFTVG